MPVDRECIVEEHAAFSVFSLSNEMRREKKGGGRGSTTSAIGIIMHVNDLTTAIKRFPQQNSAGIVRKARSGNADL